MTKANRAIDIHLVLSSWNAATSYMSYYQEVVHLHADLYASRRSVIDKKRALVNTGTFENDAKVVDDCERQARALLLLTAENKASVNRWLRVTESFVNLVFRHDKLTGCIKTDFRFGLCDKEHRKGTARLPSAKLCETVALWTGQIFTQCCSPRISVNMTLNGSGASIQVYHPGAQGHTNFFSQATLDACNAYAQVNWTGLV